MTLVLFISTWLRNRFTNTEPVHEGATESYAVELESLVLERKLDDTGNFDGSWLRTHLDLEDIQATATERIGDICQLAINMLNNDVWWKSARAVA